MSAILPTPYTAIPAAEQSSRRAEALAPDRLLERPADLVGEPVRIRGEGLLQDDPGELPVPRRAVLARRAFRERAVQGAGLRSGLHPLDLRQAPEAHAFEVGKAQPSDGPGRVPHGVGSLVAVGSGVGCPADPEGVQYDEGDARDQR